MQTNLAEQRQIIYIDSIKQENVKLRVAAYARVSSDSDEQLESFATQLTFYRNFIAKHDDWELAEVYCDEGISGASTTKRDDFNRLINDCVRGKIDRVITKSVSRFARNATDALTAVRTLSEHGVSILFEKENIDTAKAEGEMVLTMYMTFAQEELRSISENMKRGNQMRMKKGSYVPSSVPYGYRLVNNQFEIQEDEAEVIQQIFKSYLSGKGAFTIARELTRDNVPTPGDSKRWKDGTVANLLKNERFKGDMLLQKSYSADVFPMKQVKNNGAMPKYYVKNHHTSIISTEDFEKVQQIIKKNYQSGVAKEESPFRRIIQCGHCSSTFRRIVTNKKIYWGCYEHNRYSENCPVVQIPETEICNAFVRMYHKLRENYEYILGPMISALEAVRDYQYKSDQFLEQLNKDIATLSEQSHTLSTLLEQGVLDSAIFISKRDEMDKQIHLMRKEKSLRISDYKDLTLEQTKLIITILENSPQTLSGFHEELFEELVEKIIAYEDRTIGFQLINGLELKEQVAKARR